MAKVLSLSPRSLFYYSDLTLSQEFQPMGVQLSMKAALPLAQILATALCRSSNTGPRESMVSHRLHKAIDMHLRQICSWML